MNILILVLKVLISIVFVIAAIQKFTGKAAPNWARWGFGRQAMYAAGVVELVGVALLWWPGLELIGAALLGLVLLGALATLIQHREALSHIVLPGLTLVLLIVQSYLSSQM